MVPQAKIDLVRRLLAEGRTYREIATEAGVSRGTIGAVARGARREYVDLPLPESPQRGPIVRCPGCGGRVYAPCVLCRVRKLKADDRAERRRMADRIESTDRRNNPKAPEGGTSLSAAKGVSDERRPNADTPRLRRGVPPANRGG